MDNKEQLNEQIAATDLDEPVEGVGRVERIIHPTLFERGYVPQELQALVGLPIHFIAINGEYRDRMAGHIVRMECPHKAPLLSGDTLRYNVIVKVPNGPEYIAFQVLPSPMLYNRPAIPAEVTQLRKELIKLRTEWAKAICTISATHTLFQKGDRDIPTNLLDGNGDVVLEQCKVCGKGEVELGEGICEVPTPRKTNSGVAWAAVQEFAKRTGCPPGRSELAWLNGYTLGPTGGLIGKEPADQIREIDTMLTGWIKSEPPAQYPAARWDYVSILMTEIERLRIHNQIGDYVVAAKEGQRRASPAVWSAINDIAKKFGAPTTPRNSPRAALEWLEKSAEFLTIKRVTHTVGELSRTEEVRTMPVVKELTPIPMRLICPNPDCARLHIDEGEFATKPHSTHTCQNCGLSWKPALVPTVGVKFLPGTKNGVVDE